MPAHALLVHGAVVFGPVAGLLAVAYAVPALRERLRGVTLVTAVLAAVFVVVGAAGPPVKDDVSHSVLFQPTRAACAERRTATPNSWLPRWCCERPGRKKALSLRSTAARM